MVLRHILYFNYFWDNQQASFKFVKYSIIILGIRWRKASSRITRTETWKVCKTAFYVTIFQAVIILVQFYLSRIVVSAVIRKLQERHDVSAGNCVFKNKNTGAEYRYYKPVAKSDIAKQKEFDTKEQVKDVFMMSIISTLFFMLLSRYLLFLDNFSII